MSAVLALYVGPPQNDWVHSLSHLAIKTRYLDCASHSELCIDGVCYGASARDHGVRAKLIDIQSGKWELHPVLCDEPYALAQFRRMKGWPYDWVGALATTLPLLRQRAKKAYCFELTATMLGMDRPHKQGPQNLRQFGIAHAAKGGAHG